MTVAEAAGRVQILPFEVEQQDWGPYTRLWKWYVEPQDVTPAVDPREATSHRAPADERECASALAAPDRGHDAIVVRDAESAREEAARVAESFVPGTQSLYFAKWPGVGGTTAFARYAAESLAAKSKGWEDGVGAIALPRRDLVEEKARLTRQYAEEKGLNVRVRILLGKSNRSGSGWFCAAEHFESRATLHRELNRSACVGCPARDLCEEKPGCYRHERASVLEDLQEATRHGGPPILLFLTHAVLPTVWGELPKRVPIVVDEVGELLGLARELEIPWSELDTARENAGEFVEHQRDAGTTVRSAMEHWRGRTANAPVRETATTALQLSVSNAKTETECTQAALLWAGNCGFSGLRVRKLVANHWPDRQGVMRSLRSYAHSQDVLPDVLAADLVARVTGALQRQQSFPRRNTLRSGDRMRKRSGSGEALRELSRWLQRQRRSLKRAIKKLPEEYQRALMEGKVRPPRKGDGLAAWPWEEIREDDGEDLRPALAAIAIQVARECLEGREPLVRRKRRKVNVWLPDAEFMHRVKAGYVAWIAVGPMPAAVREALKVREEIVLAEPEGLRVLVLSRLGKKDTWSAFGPGDRRKKVNGRIVACPSWQDEATRDLAEKLAEKAATRSLVFRADPISSFSAVVHQLDWEAMGSPAWARYYNAGHAGTDDYAESQMLLVRRWVPPFAGCVLVAEVLCRTLGLRRPGKDSGRVGSEIKMWRYRSGVSGEGIRTACLVDALERDIQRFFELQGMLNAIGRCRPLSAGPEGRVVVFLNGRPLEWLRVSDGPMDILDQGVVNLIGVQVGLPGEEEREMVRQAREEVVARRVTKRQERLLALLNELAQEPGVTPSQRQLAVRLGTSPKTLRADLLELGPRGEDVQGGASAVLELMARLAGALMALRARLRGATRGDERGPEGTGGEVSAVGHDSYGYLIGGAPRGGHFGCIPLSSNGIGHLPGAPDVHREVSRGTRSSPSVRTVRRHLLDIRRALLGDDFAVLPKRSDKRLTRDAVLRACERLLEQKIKDQAPSTSQIDAPQLPFDRQAEVAVALAASDQLSSEGIVSRAAPVRVAESESEPINGGVDASAPPWSAGGLCEGRVEALEERAAILEFDAGHSREEAERLAWQPALTPPGQAEPAEERCA